MNPFRALFARLRRVSRSKISSVTEVLDRVAKGDLEARIQHIDRRTPFGCLCAKINEALDTTDAYLREASAATACMGRDQFHRPILLRGLHGTFRQNAVQINQAAHKMRGHSENLGLVQDQAEDTARNIQSVAAACEELDATTVEISAEANDCTQHADQVVRELTGARASFSTLVETTEKLDKIVHLLDQVAFRTQLLALNATIEAAHAGEKGAGFAVVAGEVKNMSDETHEANRTISEELHEIKRLTQSASDSYQNISRLVDEFKAVTEAIDRSVAEQRNATKQISERIIHVAARSEEIAIRIQGTRHQEPAEVAEATQPELVEAQR